jgi:hypothetical protein
MTDAALLTSLRDCYSPTDGRNILDAGLLHSAHLEPDPDAPGSGIPGVPQRYIARITLRAPSSDPGLTAQLQAQIANRLAGLEPITRTEIQLLPPLFPIL